MIKVKFISILIILISTISVKAQIVHEYYEDAFNEINSMLNNEKTISFKDAVFQVENAYFNGNLNKDIYEKKINVLKNLSLLIIDSQKLIYEEEDKEEIEKLASIYSLLTDSIPILMDTAIAYHIPYTYDFNDIWGKEDWSKMFVSKLLDEHTGNCHSLPYLYKILSDELNVKSYLSLAPNHIFIKSFSKKTGWYNTELTSANFPIDAWLMASGYIHLSAIQNGIYLDTLSNKQSLALCLIDLAQGYEKRFGIEAGEFIFKCTETALKHYPNFVNAMLMEAETQKKYFDQQMKYYKVDYPKELFINPKMKVMYMQMEQTYVKLYKLGYRQMPEKMYVDWLVSLNKEKEKFTNKNINY